MSENRKFQLNIKFGGGYEAPLLNIEGDTPQEFAANVQYAVDNIEHLVGATTLFLAAYNVQKPQDNPPPAPPVQPPAAPQGQPQGPWSQQGTQQAPPAFAQGSSFGGGDRGLNAPQQAEPQIPAQFCSHGQMQLRHNKPGAAKKWSAYMCPTPQGTPGQCKPVDAKTGKSWD